MKQSFDFVQLAWLIICSAAFLFFMWNWLQELLFYFRNGWDFEKDSGRRKLHVGHKGYKGSDYSNRASVLVAYPALLAVIALVVIMALK
jgi:hypothetical protein